MNFTVEAFTVLMNRFFDIRPGEMRRALLLQANIFLLITVILILKPNVNALFLDRFGVEQLPQAYILVAVFAAVLSTIYARALSRSHLNQIIRNTYLLSITSIVVFALLLRYNLLEDWVLYLFYIGVALLAVLSTSQFWILANVVLNAREAKRLFGFIGAGAIAGGIFGGYLTSIMAPLIGSENLLILCALLLMICLPIARTLWGRHVVGPQTIFKQKKRSRTIAEHPFRLIRQSRHLTLIAGIVAVSVVVARLVDYQFSALATESIPDPDDLASFFGFWFSTMNVISLLIQLFLTKRVVGNYGVGFSLFILPLGILIPAMVLLFIPQLWVAIILKVNDGSLKQSLNKAGVELLALPIPLETKNQTKTFIDVFVDSLATGIGGVILFVLVAGLNLSTEFISLIVLFLVILWIYLALSVRHEYLKSFKMKVIKTKDREDDAKYDFTQESVLGGLVKVLNSGTENQILYVLSKLKEIDHPRFFEPLRSLLNHASADVRCEALRRLYFYRYPSINEEIGTLTADSEEQVRIAAFEYLIEHSPNEINAIMAEFLKDENYRVRGAALVSLAFETRDNPTLRARFDLRNRILNMLNEVSKTNDNNRSVELAYLLRAIGHAGYEELYPEIEKYLGSEEKDLVIAAIQSCGYTMDRQFVQPLVLLLDNKNYSTEAEKALLSFGVGIIDEFASLVKSIVSVSKYKNISTVLEKIDSQRSVDILFELVIAGDIQTRSHALKSLSALKVRFQHLNFNKHAIIELILDEAKNYFDTLSVLYTQTQRLSKSDHIQSEIMDARNSLIDILERRLDGNLERIFHLLGLRYSPEDMHSIYDGIQSNKPDLHVNAIEFLDNLLDTNLKKILIPLVETALLETISEEAIENLNIKIPNQHDCFELLLKGKDLKVKLAVLYLIKVLRDERYIGLAREYIDDDDLKIRTFAREAIGSFQ